VLQYFRRPGIRVVAMAYSYTSFLRYLHSSGNFSGVRDKHYSTNKSIQSRAGLVLHLPSSQAWLKSVAHSAFFCVVRCEILLHSQPRASWCVVHAVLVSHAYLSVEAIRPALVSSGCTLSRLQLRQVPRAGPEAALIDLTGHYSNWQKYKSPIAIEIGDCRSNQKKSLYAV